MGRSINCLCNNCNSFKSYSMGVGMSDYSLEAFFNGENKRDYNRIIKMVNSLEKNKEEYKIYYSNEPHLCDNCGYITIKKYVSITTKYWKYEYIYSCKKCKGDLRMIDIDNEIKLGNITCSDCKSNDLSIEMEKLWD